MGVTEAAFIHTVRCTIELVAKCARMGQARNMLSAAEARSLRICEQTLARRNPELLERKNAEFEAMTDAELAVIARMPGGLGAADLDALAEAAWETFVDEMREACGGG